MKDIVSEIDELRNMNAPVMFVQEGLTYTSFVQTLDAL